jgi:hypothetical protein
VPSGGRRQIVFGPRIPRCDLRAVDVALPHEVAVRSPDKAGGDPAHAIEAQALDELGEGHRDAAAELGDVAPEMRGAAAPDPIQRRPQAAPQHGLRECRAGSATLDRADQRGVDSILLIEINGAVRQVLHERGRAIEASEIRLLHLELSELDDAHGGAEAVCERRAHPEPAAAHQRSTWAGRTSSSECGLASSLSVRQPRHAMVAGKPTSNVCPRERRSNSRPSRTWPSSLPHSRQRHSGW